MLHRNKNQMQEVMNSVKRKAHRKSQIRCNKLKSRLLKVIQTSGADPQKIIQAGKYAEMGLKSPQMYQMALDYAVKAGILTPDQLPKEPGIDYKLLANGITAGKLTRRTNSGKENSNGSGCSSHCYRGSRCRYCLRWSSRRRCDLWNPWELLLLR
jgi:hypothetical protein